MARAYIHIGLPKTATTTLQADVFPALASSRKTYVGVMQPRTVPGDPLYKKISDAVLSGIDVPGAKAALEERLNAGESVILSEEMFLSVQCAPWQEKVDRLAAILQGTDYRILVTVREPISAMFSHYVEKYSLYSAMKEGWCELAVTHNNFTIYHYEVLFEKLDAVFSLDRVYVEKFENIIKGRIEKVKEFLDESAGSQVDILIGAHNRKKSTESAVLLERRFSLAWLRPVYERLGGKRNPVLTLLASALLPAIRAFRKMSFGSIDVPRPTEEEMQAVRSIIQDRGDHYQSKYGIDYK